MGRWTRIAHIGDGAGWWGIWETLLREWVLRKVGKSLSGILFEDTGFDLGEDAWQGSQQLQKCRWLEVIERKSSRIFIGWCSWRRWAYWRRVRRSH